MKDTRSQLEQWAGAWRELRGFGRNLAGALLLTGLAVAVRAFGRNRRRRAR